MKRWLLALIILAISSPAEAQYMKGEIAIDAGVGFQFPTGLLERRLKDGSHFSLGGGVYVNSSWFLGLKLGYAKFDSEPIEKASSGLSGSRYLDVDLEARLMLYPESWFTPYILAGGGYYQVRTWTNTPAVEVIATRSQLGLSAGFGLNGHRITSPLSMYTEVVYHHIPANLGSEQYVRWTTGLRLSFGGRPF